MLGIHEEEKRHSYLCSSFSTAAVPVLSWRERRKRVLAEKVTSKSAQGSRCGASSLEENSFDGDLLVPGFGAECMSGAHAQCSERPGECRCTCHSHTQALIRKGPNKGDSKGGIRRKIKMPVVPAVPGIIEAAEQPESELHNTCPQCHTRAKPTDQFCRKDGTRLCIGKPCPRCEAPCDEPDVHCWGCGWKLDQPVPKEQIPARSTLTSLPPSSAPSREVSLPPEPGEIEVVSTAETPPAEDPIVRLRQIAHEQGLLPRETQVS